MIELSKKENRVQLTKSGRRIFGFFGLAFGSLFLLVGLGMVATILQRAWKQRSTVNWSAVEGTILATDLNKNPRNPADSPLMYEFSLYGKVYRSTQVAFVDAENLDYHTWLQMANGLPRDGAVTVYHNPDNPHESVLVAGYHHASLSGLGEAAGMTGFSIVWMTFWWGLSNWLPDRLEKAESAHRKQM